MLVGPVFSVEMVTSARRARYFLLRIAYATILLLIMWGIYESAFFAASGSNLTIRAKAELTAGFFYSFGYLQLVTVLLAGPAIAAGTIAEERQRRTIEYLFATDLTNREIVFDKLAGRIALIAYLLLVGLPILAIFRLLGGIPLDALLLLFLITASTTLAVSTLSLALSVWASRPRDAVMRTYLVLFAILVLPAIFSSFLRFYYSGTTIGDLLITVADGFLRANPLPVLGQTLRPTVPGVSIWRPVLEMAGIHFCAAFLSIAVATAVVRRVHLRAVGRVRRQRSWSPIGRWRPRPGTHPMLWKELFARHALTRLGLAAGLAALLVVLATAALTLAAFLQGWDELSRPSRAPLDNSYLQYAATAGAVTSCAVLLLIGMRAAGAITGEKERNCWLSLISTPLSARQIVWAKVLGGVYALRWLLAVPITIWALSVAIWPVYLCVLPVQIAILLLLAFFASSVGVFASFFCRTTTRAMGATVAAALFLGGGYLGFCCLPLGANDSPIIMAACAPFLLAFPSFFCSALLHLGSLGPGSRGMEIVVAFVLGVAGYGGGLAMLTTAMQGNFDQLAGRSRLPNERLQIDDLADPMAVEDRD